MQETNVTSPVNTFECFTTLARLEYPSILSEIIQWNDDRRSANSLLWLLSKIRLHVSFENHDGSFMKDRHYRFGREYY